MIHKEAITEKDEFIEDFSRIYKSLPLRERMYLMTRIYEYEEKYNENENTEQVQETAPEIVIDYMAEFEKSNETTTLYRNTVNLFQQR